MIASCVYVFIITTVILLRLLSMMRAYAMILYRAVWDNNRHSCVERLCDDDRPREPLMENIP
jgi:hypothetical protein